MNKAIICGGRDYTPKFWDQNEIAKLCIKHNIEEIVTGGATGADTFGARIAEEAEVTSTIFPAHWHTYGRRAGMIRNTEMAEYLDDGGDNIVIALPGGAGTALMVKIARGLLIKVYEIEDGVLK